MEETKKQQNTFRYKSLDGLRGIMTLFVFIAHVNYNLFPGAIIFMDTFFIMSSFFITRLLLNDLKFFKNIDFNKFYSRRFKRLLPALAIMLLTLVVFEKIANVFHWQNYLHVFAAVFYFTNWIRALSIPHFGTLGHTWSLSIEEQFYLFWPIVLHFIYRYKSSKKTAMFLLICIIIFTFSWRGFQAFSGVSFDRLYNGTDMRLDSLSFGAILALCYDAEIIIKFKKICSHVVSLIILILLMTIGGLFTHCQTVEWYLWQEPLYELISLGLIVGLTESNGNLLVGLIFENPVSVYLGKICYGFYLWHYPILIYFGKMFSPNIFPKFLFCLPATLVVAAISYELIESPLLNNKKKFPINQTFRARKDRFLEYLAQGKKV